MKYTGDATLGVSLLPQMEKPLDARLVVDSIEELYQISPNIAYLGMPVVHAPSGYIYVLTDKNNINNRLGWKASYESILIEQLDQSEYDKRVANTLEGRPIDESQEYIRENVYYYINEDSIDNPENDSYVSYSQLADVLKAVSDKASTSTLNVYYQTLLNTIATNKSASEESVANVLVKVGEVEALFANYYTSEKSDELFVKKDSIITDGNYIFVDKESYTEDLKLIKLELANTIKTEGGGNLENLTVSNLTAKGIVSETITIKKSDTISEEVATKSEIPNFEVITYNDYQTLVENEKTEADKYYYVTDAPEDDTAYVRKNYVDTIQSSLLLLLSLKASSISVEQQISKLQDTISELQSKIETLLLRIENLEE